MPTFTDLPTELLLFICSLLDNPGDICNFLRLTRRTSGLPYVILDFRFRHDQIQRNGQLKPQPPYNPNRVARLLLQPNNREVARAIVSLDPTAYVGSIYQNFRLHNVLPHFGALRNLHLAATRFTARPWPAAQHTPLALPIGIFSPWALAHTLGPVAEKLWTLSIFVELSECSRNRTSLRDFSAFISLSKLCIPSHVVFGDTHSDDLIGHTDMYDPTVFELPPNFEGLHLQCYNYYSQGNMTELVEHVMRHEMRVYQRVMEQTACMLLRGYRVRKVVLHFMADATRLRDCCIGLEDYREKLRRFGLTRVLDDVKSSRYSRSREFDKRLWLMGVEFESYTTTRYGPCWV